MKISIPFYLIGLVLIGFGVTLTIKADLGAGAWDALNVGLSETLGFTVGTWIIIVGIILIFINALIVKGKPKYLSLITIILIGLSVDFWLHVLKGYHYDQLSEQLLALIGGTLTIAGGVTMYLQTKLPVNPIDQLMVSLHERFRLNLMAAKTICEVCALLAAFLLHGPIGIGTIVITVLIGPIIQLMNKPISKRYEILTKKFG